MERYYRYYFILFMQFFFFFFLNLLIVHSHHIPTRIIKYEDLVGEIAFICEQ